ncbi:MAG: DNA polymerase III, partial [Candidatus Aminicenantes bacterium]|nr:DNA polymerase III [Candidatus Aminicenantes bacterium]
MPITNNDVAEIFDEVADFLEIKGDNPFRVRAYRNASRVVSGLSRGVAELAAEEKGLEGIAGIGKDLAEKIRTIVETKKLPFLEDLKKEFPPGLSAMLKVRGLGPKKVAALHKGLGIASIKDLEKAASAGKIRELDGFSVKTEQSILEEIARGHVTDQGPERLKLARAEETVTPLVEELKKAAGVEEIAIAGSLRRRAETVGDVDILTAAGKSGDIVKRFAGYEDVEKVLAEGETKSSVVLR